MTDMRANRRDLLQATAGLAGASLLYVVATLGMTFFRRAVNGAKMCAYASALRIAAAEAARHIEEQMSAGPAPEPAAPAELLASAGGEAAGPPIRSPRSA